MGKSHGSQNPHSFAAKINAATRAEHITLNRLILARLPLGLPPVSQDPSAYATGIAAFAEIFFAFEQEWQQLISEPRSRRRPYHTECVNLLSSLYQPRLLRSKRLESDIATLNVRLRSPKSLSVSDRRLDAASLDISQQIHASIRLKPHVLLAYSWVMYMALLSGGRWMRQELLHAGPSFWRAPPSTSTTISPADGDPFGCLSLFFFEPDTEDGLALKDAFKIQFEEVANQLDEKQKSDIIDEAVGIFRMCLGLVAALDEALMQKTMEGTHAKLVAEAALSPLDVAPSIPLLKRGRRAFQTRTAVVLMGVALTLYFYVVAFTGSSGSNGESVLSGDW